MLGINTTGRPDKKDYLLGRACVFLSELDGTTGLPECFTDLGNTPSVSVSVDIEELTHRASLCDGGAQVDRTLVIQATFNVTLTLEEVNHFNAALFFGGDVATHANPAVAGFTQTLTTSVAQGCWYCIREGAVSPMGFDAADLTVTLDPGGAATVLVQGTDYLVNVKTGMIFFVVGGGATVGTDVDVTLAANAGAPATVERVNGLTQTSKEYALKLVIENENNGAEQALITFWSMSLRADGDFSPVGDEFAQLSLAGVAQRNANVVNPDGSLGATLWIDKAVG